MAQPNQDENEILSKLRSSVSNMNTTGRSKANVTPLDDKDDVVMGQRKVVTGDDGATAKRRMRPRRAPGPSDDAMVIPINLDDDDESTTGTAMPVKVAASPFAPPSHATSATYPARPPMTAVQAAAAPTAAAPASTSTDVVKLREELGKVRAERTAFEEAKRKLETELKQVKEELDESKEGVEVWEDLVRTLAKKDECDPQEFYDIVDEWKGKAKVFEQGQKAVEDNKALQKQVAQLRDDLEAQKLKVAEAEAAAKKLNQSKPGSTGPAPTSSFAAATGPAQSEWKTKYEQALKDLDVARAKCTNLEKDLKGKEAEVAELKGRLQVAIATNSSAGVAGEEDPLIEMVEKLMKEMEAMAKENEEYMARLEEEIFSGDRQDDSSSTVEEEQEVEEEVPPPKPAAIAFATPQRQTPEAPKPQHQQQQKPTYGQQQAQPQKPTVGPASNQAQTKAPATNYPPGPQPKK